MKKRNTEKLPLNYFLNSLKHHDTETKITMILQRIANGSVDLIILYIVNNDDSHIPLDYYGDYEINKIHYFKTISSIPILKNGCRRRGGNDVDAASLLLKILLYHQLTLLRLSGKKGNELTLL